MNTNKCIALVAVFGLAAGGALVAQGQYDVFGDGGCVGNGKPCGPVFTGKNTTGGTLTEESGTRGYTYALPGRTTTATDVCGFQIFARCDYKAHQVSAYLLSDQNGLPGDTLAMTRMFIGCRSVPFWYSASFSSPVSLPAETNFWVAFEYPDPSMRLPILVHGETTAGAVMEPQKPWQLGSPDAWAYRITEAVPAAAPACTEALASANFELPLLPATLPTEMDHAIPFDATGRGGKVCGLWVIANNRGATAPVKVRSFLLLDDNGMPGELVRTGTFTIGSNTMIYRSSWTPYPIVRGQRFWFGWSNPDVSIQPPLAQGGKLCIYATKPSSGTGWTMAKQPLPWNYVVKMTDETGNEWPALTSSGTPRLNDRFVVHLDLAPAQTPAVLWTGSSNTIWGPLKLPFVIPGTYGCLLQVAFDGFPIISVTDAQGRAEVPFDVPNAPELAGVKVCQQWAVVDLLSSSLGFTFSNGGRATIGN